MTVMNIFYYVLIGLIILGSMLFMPKKGLRIIKALLFCMIVLTACFPVIYAIGGEIDNMKLADQILKNLILSTISLGVYFMFCFFLSRAWRNDDNYTEVFEKLSNFTYKDELNKSSKVISEYKEPENKSQ
jgi:uncharacterized membrane protein